MGFLINLLKNSPKLRAWVSVIDYILESLEQIAEKINKDNNLPNLK